MPISDMEEQIVVLIAQVRHRTGWTDKQISVNLGHHENYLRDGRTRKALHTMQAGTLLRLAMMAGRKMTFT